MVEFTGALKAELHRMQEQAAGSASAIRLDRRIDGSLALEIDEKRYDDVCVVLDYSRGLNVVIARELQSTWTMLLSTSTPRVTTAMAARAWHCCGIVPVRRASNGRPRPRHREREHRYGEVCAEGSRPSTRQVPRRSPHTSEWCNPFHRSHVSARGAGIILSPQSVANSLMRALRGVFSAASPRFQRPLAR
jgi:hypothetical protein